MEKKLWAGGKQEWGASRTQGKEKEKGKREVGALSKKNRKKKFTPKIKPGVKIMIFENL